MCRRPSVADHNTVVQSRESSCVADDGGSLAAAHREEMTDSMVAAARTDSNGAGSSVASGTPTYPEPAERARLGKQARKAVPLDSHADLSVGADRDPVAVLTDQDAS